MKVVPFDKLGALAESIAFEVDAPPVAVTVFVPKGPARTIADALLYVRSGWHVDGKTVLFDSAAEYARRARLVAAWMGAPTLAHQDPATREAWIWAGWTDNVNPFGLPGGTPFVKVLPGTSLQELIDTYDPNKIPGGGDE